MFIRFLLKLQFGFIGFYRKIIVRGIWILNLCTIDKNNKRAVKNWAERELEKLNNKELLEGLSNFEDNGEQIEDRIFDDTPCVEAVEEDDTYELLMQTRLWKAYNEDEDEIIGG